MLNKKLLDRLYRKYNRREFVHPDPLEFLYNYPDVRDREIAGLIASSLAYGRVNQILKSVGIVLQKMGDSPCEFVMNSSDKKILKTFAGFRHRFHACRDLSVLIAGARRVIKKYGSLNECFLSGLKKTDDTVVYAMGNFVKKLSLGGGLNMLPPPEKGSACKRLNLFLRWMIRHDDVDPGGWVGISPERLIVPLDTHMHKIGITLGLSRRKQADMRTALEITKGFAEILPDDPVKYDFSLTRFGIRDDMELKHLFDLI